LYDQVTAGLAPGKDISRFCKEVSGLAAATHAHILPEYGLGQGIGLSLQESPLISEAETFSFREGMCLALRLAVKNGETGFAMTGETVYLSPDGPEVLTGP
jgi:Xaa-Pro aminopeptidase